MLKSRARKSKENYTLHHIPMVMVRLVEHEQSDRALSESDLRDYSLNPFSSRLAMKEAM
jgi:hypothetical protein